MLAKISPKSLFLIDSLGALSSIISGLILAQFESFLGVSADIFYTLAAIAVFFCIFSSCCFLQMVKNQQLGLKIIATANFSYCGLSAIAGVYSHQNISIWGIFYFIIEILIIASLATVEWKKAQTITHE